MVDALTMGEILVEIMRPRPDMALGECGAEFLGPFPSGAPAIFADTVARLGHSSAIIGGVGNDEFGWCVLERLRRDGVSDGCVWISKKKPTALAFVTYFRDGSRKFLFYLAGTSAAAATKAPKPIPPARIFHVMGCSLFIDRRFSRAIVDVAGKLFSTGTMITFDPNIRSELLEGRDIRKQIEPLMRMCSIFLPGVRELSLLTGEGRLDAAARKLLQDYPMETIVAKQGRKGCTVFTRETNLHIPGYQVEEADPTGAGDCFDAGFVCGVLEDKALEECARMGAAAGALNAAAFGPMQGDISREAVQGLIGKGFDI